MDQTKSDQNPPQHRADHIEIVISEGSRGVVQVDHPSIAGFRKYNVTWKYEPANEDRFFAIVVRSPNSPFFNRKRIITGKKKAIEQIRAKAELGECKYDVYFELRDGSIGHLDPIVVVSDEGRTTGPNSADSDEINTRVQNAIKQQKEAVEDLRALRKRL